MVKKGAKILRNNHIIGWLKGALEKGCPLTRVPGVFHTSLEGCVLAGQRPSLYFFIGFMGAMLGSKQDLAHGDGAS